MIRRRRAGAVRRRFPRTAMSRADDAPSPCAAHPDRIKAEEQPTTIIEGGNMAAGSTREAHTVHPLTRWVALAALAVAGFAHAQSTDLKSLLPALKQGGYVIVLRHGATDPKQEDVYPLDYKDMSKQRQLSDAGRDVARQVGAAFRKLGIPIGSVYTSRLNRAQETGKLISGKEVDAREELNDSSMGSTSAMAGSAGGGSSRHGEALRKMATAAAASGTNTLIVTHKTNITDAFGKDWGNVKEGEATVFKADGATTLTPVARVQASDWVALAAAP